MTVRAAQFGATGLDHLARYARRFPKSVYLPQFTQRVGSLLASMNGFGEPELAALVQDRLKTHNYGLVLSATAGVSYEFTQSILLDLNYEEDSSAHVDMNVVKTGAGRFVEVQGTAEGQPFSDEELLELLAAADKGIRDLVAIQKKALGDFDPAKP